MKATPRRLLFAFVLVVWTFTVVRFMVSRDWPRKDLAMLRELGFTDEMGDLSERFKQELDLKQKLLKETLQEHGLPGMPNFGHKGRQLSDIDVSTYFRGSNNPDDMLAIKPPSYLSNFKNPCWYEKQSNQSTDSTVLRCLPYFHLIGVDKSGTTDLWYRLSHHPEFVRPKAVMGKETHWWSWRRFGFDIWVRDKEIRHFDWYLQHFDLPASKIEANVQPDNLQYHPMITGEGSPTVFWDFTGWNMIPQNKDKTEEEAWLTPHCIKHLTPNAKFIVIVRNPTKRLYSDYLFLDRFRSYHNVSVEGFHQDVLRSLDMLTDCFAKRSELKCLYDKELHMKIPVRIIVGMYDVFLEKWLKVFPADQILTLRNEDYSKKVKDHMKQIINFLGLNPLQERELDRIAALPRVFENAAGVKTHGPMKEETRRVLDIFYAKYNKQLATRLKDSKFLWQD